LVAQNSLRLIVELFLLVVALAAGIMVSVYPRYAPRRGWRVKPSFRKSGGSIMTIGLASMIGATILILTSSGSWWVAALAITGGIVGAIVLLHVLKSSVQSLAFVLIAFAWLWFVLVRWGT
jgi:hypothetical protein